MSIVTVARAAEMECCVFLGPTCCGPKCMGWRAVSEVTCRTIMADRRHVTSAEEPTRPSLIPASWSWVPYDAEDGSGGYWCEPEASRVLRDRGYCGRAGRPEEVLE